MAYVNLLIAGGVDFEFSPAGYDISATLTTDLPPHHFFSDVHMTAVFTPSTGDPR